MPNRPQGYVVLAVGIISAILLARLASNPPASNPPAYGQSELHFEAIEGGYVAYFEDGPLDGHEWFVDASELASLRESK